MRPSKYRLCFDKKASNLAALSPDGRLRVWETTNGNLCHEWIPPATLKATCSCLCWAHSDTGGRPKAKKARKSTQNSDDGAKSHLVFGTLQGSLILLNCDTLEVENKLVHEHKSRINDICHNDKKDTLYSGADDKYIIEWTYPTLNVKSKWKAEKQSVNKLEVSPDGNCILSAGRSIKLWDIDTKELLQKFTGHSNPVTNLFFPPMSSGRNYSEECYFLSTADEDNLINAWHHDPTSEDTNAVCCFMNASNPGSIDITVNSLQQLKLAVGCLDGRVNIFTQILNGRLAKPVDSSLNFQLVNSKSKETSSAGIRILAVKLVDDDILLLVYGSPVSPTFEKIKISTLVSGSKIKREASKGLLQGKSERTTPKSKEKRKADKSVVIESHVPVEVKLVEERELATANSETVDEKREELTLGERLNPVATPSKGSKSRKSKSRRGNERIDAASMTQMLTQALHSDDDKLLDNVLYRTNKAAVITRTLERLPSSFVLTLINKIVERIQDNPARIYDLTTWIKSLMAVHITYLISMPNLMSTLSGLYQILDSRTKVYPKLSKLHGRLNLLLSHVAQRKHTPVKVAEINESALVVEDKEESEEEEEEDKDEDLEDQHEGDSQKEDSESEEIPGSSDESDNEQLIEKEKDVSDYDSDSY